MKAYRGNGGITRRSSCEYAYKGCLYILESKKWTFGIWGWSTTCFVQSIRVFCMHQAVWKLPISWSWKEFCFMGYIPLPPPINPLNAKSNPICHLLELLVAQPILHISRKRVKHYYFESHWQEGNLITNIWMTLSIIMNQYSSPARCRGIAGEYFVILACSGSVSVSGVLGVLCVQPILWRCKWICLPKMEGRIRPEMKP